MRAFSESDIKNTLGALVIKYCEVPENEAISICESFGMKDIYIEWEKSDWDL